MENVVALWEKCVLRSPGSHHFMWFLVAAGRGGLSGISVKSLMAVPSLTSSLGGAVLGSAGARRATKKC